MSADNDLQIHSIAYNRVLDAIEEDAPDEKREYKEIENYRIEIDNVTFRYKGAEFDVLKNFSLTIEQGERVGIVGESGRGKTTLLHLMAGMLEPIQGEIRFGNHLLSEVKIAESMIQDALSSIGADKTIVIVSHRENSLKLCQRLVYL